MAKRPIQFKIDVLAMRESGLSAKEAFRVCCEKYDMKPSGCMTKYASGFIRDYENEVKAKLFDRDPNVVSLCHQSNLYVEGFFPYEKRRVG